MVLVFGSEAGKLKGFVKISIYLLSQRVGPGNFLSLSQTPAETDLLNDTRTKPLSSSDFVSFALLINL